MDNNIFCTIMDPILDRYNLLAHLQKRKEKPSSADGGTVTGDSDLELLKKKIAEANYSPRVEVRPLLDDISSIFDLIKKIFPKGCFLGYDDRAFLE